MKLLIREEIKDLAFEVVVETKTLLTHSRLADSRQTRIYLDSMIREVLQAALNELLELPERS